MSRRVKLPGASELFRPTGPDPTAPRGDEAPTRPRAVEDGERAPRPAPTAAPARSDAPGPAAVADDPAGAVTGGSGRVRHEEKITVYVSREELLAIEQARLRLRGELGLAVDRGRLVRAAMALALADLDAAGGEGELVRRLTAS